MKALLALEDGRIFPCRSFTGSGEIGGEVVFNTSMTGYQEILTDPSYNKQMVTMTYPLIGNYGVNVHDVESDKIQVSAFIVREYQSQPSNFRSETPLAHYLKKQKILGIEEIDTRALTRHIRREGSMRGIISTIDLNPLSLMKRANDIQQMKGYNLAEEISTKIAYRWDSKIDSEKLSATIKDKTISNTTSKANDVQINPTLETTSQIGKIALKNTVLDKNIWKYPKEKYSVVVLDFGVKYNILRCLENAGCEVVVLPASTSFEVIKNINPDGVFLSNGPGDPEPVVSAVSTVKNLLGYKPIFGICLGHQILCLALGGKTFKLKFGHRGGNQPVKNLLTGKVEITSQNHGFAVNMKSMNGKDVQVTHINLNDNTVEGIRHTKLPAFAVQYHPEASPGPNDASYLFKEFINLMGK
ncbi:MAG: carbamoyl phosphate synthase small subunit [Desulfobacteraceae bacterium 4572_19]|nr:MAG: carbamoyl phosphate synthase small subunit [Desulfobacteraceae bacterium 4572_19]